MGETNRRTFLRLATGAAAGGAAIAAMPVAIQRALAQPAQQVSGTIQDVKHVVILMQENRSFDHYFGTLRGVRGFGDRHPIPLPGGRDVWRQSDGKRELPPFHLDTSKTDALRVPGTPHSYADAQAAWGQGKIEEWPRFKTAYSMGYYRREDIPFQFALAEAFTICDAYHCSVTAGTDPNRIVFWSGSSSDPELRAKGVDCTDDHAEPDNWRCWVKGALPEPGYTYAGNSLKWDTIPDVLEKAGVSWRIYQDPNNNWTGAMHGGLAFESFRTCKPGSALYEKGMRHWSLEQLARDVQEGTLPAVSWVLPSAPFSEHPGASTPLQGAEFTAQVLEALTANPEVWGKTVFFLTFDENDGQFDHLPPPAPPSYDAEGRLAGKSTLDLRGHYFSDPQRKHIDARDTQSGLVRPFGLGPRVPMYVVSPWSKGGWVSSETFDHTSVGQFLETRFGVTVPGISPWHRAVCGDLTSAFDFARPNDPAFPDLPDVSGASAVVLQHIQRPRIMPPEQPQPVHAETGVRPSRALPYVLNVKAEVVAGEVRLEFRNGGKAGAVFHVYDRLHLDRIPRRYTVEAGKAISDVWTTAGDGGRYDLAVFSHNGFRRDVQGEAGGALEIEVRYRPQAREVELEIRNGSTEAQAAVIRHNAYGEAGGEVRVPARGRSTRRWSVADAGDWYDVSVAAQGVTRRAAGRMETGAHGISDPAMGA
ncbi:MAG: phospholipase C, phosphocholine-specific [Phenylobacterium sp. RIFCSPHIGHO2_01_FULL_69_31]|uniref:phosphocholine-specific phospholipase C n=1 Tax=Phenylobacterium sp. RIFCSPHIGHO2_01_FULL_69_31 TaxID=1801944 RepID=UPI0008BE14CD|nr:phospholipase C, phosphocholine-specific [Phenylobacterium sp. RIFCSPHIGHO2_01_FULL_69_31]OHB31965.1 MAG: phospholipase C, phosphocholine-specific [Phenylobacterium sp. RIFCSPHIGHO2_01_FULL_69_31]